MEKLSTQNPHRKEEAIKRILRRIIEIYSSDDPEVRTDFESKVEELGLEDLRAVLPDIETTR